MGRSLRRVRRFISCLRYISGDRGLERRRSSARQRWREHRARTAERRLSRCSTERHGRWRPAPTVLTHDTPPSSTLETLHWPRALRRSAYHETFPYAGLHPSRRRFYLSATCAPLLPAQSPDTSGVWFMKHEDSRFSSVKVVVCGFRLYRIKHQNVWLL